MPERRLFLMPVQTKRDDEPDDAEHDAELPTPDHDGERETPATGEPCGYPVDRTADDWPDAADDADVAAIADDDGAE
jgi:hypothetical protein